MNRAIEIKKAAFLALVNDVCGRVVVDTRYETVNGVTRLILIYSDGAEKEFKGLKAA